MSVSPRPIHLGRTPAPWFHPATACAATARVATGRPSPAHPGFRRPARQPAPASWGDSVGRGRAEWRGSTQGE